MIVRFEGFAQFQRSLREIEPKLLAGFRKELVAVGEPVAKAAHGLAVQNIPKVTEPWSEFRVGATTNLVYVAPKQRGVKGGPTKRPKFASLLLKRALEPAAPLADGILQQRADEALRRVIGKAGL